MVPLRVVVFSAFGALSCGPSFQAVYEGEVRFEHCYAVDQSGAPSEAKTECWRAWLHGYTYGQPRDRVEYAAARYSQLSLGPTLPTEETRDGGPPRHVTAMGAPTSAFAPPPNLAASSTASVSSALVAAQDPVARAPGADCSDACVRGWTACHDGCDAGRACDDCDRSYRLCVPGCLREDAGHAPRGSKQ